MKILILINLAVEVSLLALPQGAVFSRKGRPNQLCPSAGPIPGLSAPLKRHSLDYRLHGSSTTSQLQAMTKPEARYVLRQQVQIDDTCRAASVAWTSRGSENKVPLLLLVVLQG